MPEVVVVQQMPLPLVMGSAVGTEMDWSDEVLFHDLRSHFGQRQSPLNCSFPRPKIVTRGGRDGYPMYEITGEPELQNVHRHVTFVTECQLSLPLQTQRHIQGLSQTQSWRVMEFSKTFPGFCRRFSADRLWISEFLVIEKNMETKC